MSAFLAPFISVTPGTTAITSRPVVGLCDRIDIRGPVGYGGSTGEVRPMGEMKMNEIEKM
jgi:hypothetical protein